MEGTHFLIVILVMLFTNIAFYTYARKNSESLNHLGGINL